MYMEKERERRAHTHRETRMLVVLYPLPISRAHNCKFAMAGIADDAAAKPEGCLHKVLCFMPFIGLFFMTSPFFYGFFDLPPGFSVQLTAVAGLDAPPPGATIFPVFNLTLHHANRHFLEICYWPSEVVVAYGRFTIATGRTPGFCVGGKEAKEVAAVAWGGGVGLPERLRGRMATERRAGALELEVDFKLSRGGEGLAGRPEWMWCKVRTRSEQRSEVTPCTAFSLQDWASESTIFMEERR